MSDLSDMALSQLVEAILAQNAILGQIAVTLVQIAQGDTDPDRAPAIQADLAGFLSFDWQAIGASVMAADNDGPTVVSWRGHTFKRRAPDNAYDAAIWFSRCVGKGEDGNNEYARLITFKPLKADDVQPLGRKAERAIGSARPPAPPAAVARVTGQDQATIERAIAASDRDFAATGPSQGDELRKRREADAAKAAQEAERKSGTAVTQGQLPGTARQPGVDSPKAAHWIDDPDTRSRFWKFASGNQLSQPEVYRILGIEHIHDYRGTKSDALAALTAAIKARHEAPPA